MSTLIPIYSGFDGLELAYRAQLPPRLQAVLEEAKAKACARRSAVVVEWGGRSFHVGEAGRRGGYAFSVDSGPMGANWFFKRANDRDPWGVFVSSRALPLALLCADKVKAGFDEFLENLGLKLTPDCVRVSRVDFAVDFLAPEFILKPDNIVSHARYRHNQSAYVDIHGISGKRSGVRVGSMPGAQAAIYDKRKDVQDKKKNEWWAIWDDSAQRRTNGCLRIQRGAPIWRCELRAGRAFLDKQLRHRTWNEFANEAKRIFAEIHARIRYANPNSDSNRSRWPNNELWRLLGIELAEISLRAGNPELMPDILRRLECEGIQRLSDQAKGLLFSLAAASGIPFQDIESFFDLFLVECKSELRALSWTKSISFADKQTDWAARFRTSNPR